MGRRDGGAIALHGVKFLYQLRAHTAPDFTQISRVQRMRHVWHGRDSKRCSRSPRAKMPLCGGQVRVKLPANTTHSSLTTATHLLARPVGAGCVLSAHYATPAHTG